MLSLAKICSWLNVSAVLVVQSLMFLAAIDVINLLLASI
jgi:hypothetical protein